MQVIVTQGTSPLILAMPHVGTEVPPEIWAKLNPLGQSLADTDWHIDQLYEGLAPEATVVRATFHRYVIDANRGADDASLYPGQNTTGLVPATDFDGHPIWHSPPDESDVAGRIATNHAAYHAALATEIARVKAIHGVAVLWDCHSIRSRIPYLFEGQLPDLNLGTNSGASCARRLSDHVAARMAASPFTQIVNGRFKGGWTTRHYGQPQNGIHALQMEIAQSAYLRAETAPWAFDSEKAVPLRDVLKEILSEISAMARELKVMN